MTTNPEELVTDQTRDAEEQEAEHVQGEPDRMPTEEEAAVAERHATLSEDVKENYQQAMETGANAKGEGRIT